MQVTQEQIDASADALRQHEQGGRLLRNWKALPSGTKNKWREKAEVALRAALKEQS